MECHTADLFLFFDFRLANFDFDKYYLAHFDKQFWPFSMAFCEISFSIESIFNPIFLVTFNLPQ